MGICDRYVLMKLVCLGNVVLDKAVSGSECSEVGLMTGKGVGK